MANAKRLMSIVLVLAMVVTMASFPVSASTDFYDATTVKIAAVSATNDGTDAPMIIDGYGDESGVKAGNYSCHKTVSVGPGDGSAVLTTVVIDLGAEYNINKMFARFGSNVIRQGTLYVSDDNATWREITKISGIAYSTETVNWSNSFERTIAMDGCARYVKLDITECKQAGQIPVYEIVFYGSEKLENPVEYTVKYVDEYDRPIAPEKTGVVPDGSLVTEQAADVSGYMYVDTSVTKDLTVDKNGDNVIIFDKYVAIPKNEIGKMDLTGSTVAISPTSQRYSNNPATIFDGDVSRTNGNGIQWNWTAQTTVKTVEITLAELSDIESMKIHWGNKDWNALPAQTYNIYVAGPDGVYGDAVYTYTDNASGQNGKSRDDVITFDTILNYVTKIKIEITAHYKTGDPAIREIEMYGAKAILSTSSASVTVEHHDVNGNPIENDIFFVDNLGTAVSITPTEIDGYKYVGTANLDFVLDVHANDYVVDLIYEAIPNVLDLPVEDGYVAMDSTNVPFEFKVATPENVNPEDVFAAANWVVDNCTISSVKVTAVDDPATLVYEWNVVVTVVPTNNDGFSLTLDLPVEYELVDSITFKREATNELLDSAVTEGDNAILLDKTTINLKYKADGSIETTLFDRMVNATIRVQGINEDALPYKGYDDVAIEVKELKANGEKVRFDFEEDFVRVGDEYYGTFTFAKGGVERFEATVVLYGVNADGTRVELDTATVFSEMINITESYPKEQTDAQKAIDYTHAPDILDQLIGQVHPYDLPNLSEGDWAFYQAVLEARGMKEQTAKDKVAELKKLITDEQAKVEDPNWVAPDYPDDIIIDNHRIEGSGVYKTIIRVGPGAWNALKDLHVNSFSIRGPHDKPTGDNASYVANETIVEDFFITFRNGIDYDYTNWLGTSFCIRLKDIGQSNEYKNVDLRKGYNAVRRALNDDQVNPIMFRLDWYNWPSADNPNPFSGGIITVQVTEDWINNNGMFNLATYHMSGYNYTEDNDPELTLMKDKVSVSNYINRYVSVEIEGDKEMYDSYVIVGTDKLPSELPETVGTYFDVE